MYLDYDTYKEIGGVLDEAAFNQFIFKEESYINTATFNRLKSMDEIPEAVLHCLRDLLEVSDKISKLSTQNDDNIASWSNDGVSVSYNKLSKTELEQMKNEIIRSYLLNEVTDSGTPLLYCGVN